MAVGSNGNVNRQKMINLMYLVFIAMMALNVSSEVLDGFRKVDEGLSTSMVSTVRRNELIMSELEAAAITNPSKAGTWLMRGQNISKSADSLFLFIDDLKLQIARKSDGKGADPKNIKYRDDLEASNVVMLNPVGGKAPLLRKKIDDYRTLAAELMTDSTKLHAIEQVLNTKNPSSLQSWEAALFEDMPTSAAMTMLTKLQNDIRYTQGEVLANLLNAIDVGDYRVNQITAQIIPESNVVMRGDTYRGQVVLLSVDSTKQPTVYLNNKSLPFESKGSFAIPTSSAGTYPISGYVELDMPGGEKIRRDFNSEYFVSEPMASVAPTMMNVLYAGIENPISIAVPGVPSQSVTATMTNGTLSRRGDLWVAKPSKVGSESVITVMAKMADGRQVSMANTKLKVRALPDPMPYIEFKDAQGTPQRFKRGRIAKAQILAAGGIKAAIDDNVLDVAYKVTSFSTTFFDSMGNAIPEVSNGANFSERQLSKIRSLQRGKRFYITDVMAVGPDNVTRRISDIEVIVN